VLDHGVVKHGLHAGALGVVDDEACRHALEPLEAWR
jgi:hypothetical protein